MSVDFKNLETFLEVARLASFRAASLRLNATQPAISQRVAQLESQLGVRLFVRESRRVTPTPKGRELMLYAEKLLALRAEMVAAVGDPATLVGVLRIGVAETIVHTWLPRLIERVSRDYPRLTIEIEVDISPNMRERLISREIDLAFLMDTFAGEPLVSRDLCRHALAFRRLAAAGGGQHDDDARGPRAPSDHDLLASHQALRGGLRGLQSPRSAARAAPRLGLDRHAGAHGGTGARHRRHPAGDRPRPSRRRPAGDDRHARALPPDLSFRAAWLPGVDVRSREVIAELAGEEAASNPFA